jgi:hypothetical protein
MVAVILVVASVVVIAMLQGQTDNFGNYTDQQTQGSSCGLAAQRLATTLDCSTDTSSDVSGIPAYEDNKQCWDSSTSDAYNSAC